MRTYKTIPIMERIESKLKIIPYGCHIFTGSKNQYGYGRIWNQEEERLVLVHRAVYENTFGSIPEGLEINHICKNTSCANLLHLELVSHRQNVLMGVSITANNHRKKFCKSGHTLSGTNVYHPIGRPTERNCRTCHVLQNREYRKRKREKQNAISPRKNVWFYG